MNMLLRFRVAACAVFLLCVATAIAAYAQTFTSLVSFDLSDGVYPLSALVQGVDGNFYGTTQNGGTDNDGTVFRVTPEGVFTTLQSFDGTDGSYANGGLAQATDGNLYGTTEFGGAQNGGTVFKITPQGVFSTLYSFCSKPNCSDGEAPYAALIQVSDGSFYGTTSEGGRGYGTVYNITPTGVLRTLYSFCTRPGCPDGASPDSPVTQGTDGNFYGTAFVDGAYGYGTVFKLTPQGQLVVLHSFNGADDGGYPLAGLVQASNGNLYGAAYLGGPNSGCGFYGCGTIFEITPSGTFTMLHNFDSSDGWNPTGGLIQATDGNLYGTTNYGGANAWGTIFRISPAGELSDLYSFCAQANCTDGTDPNNTLVQGTDGKIYGPTQGGGIYDEENGGYGTVFGFALGLRPFVETLPSTGKIASQVLIFGQQPGEDD